MITIKGKLPESESMRHVAISSMKVPSWKEIWLAGNHEPQSKITLFCLSEVSSEIQVQAESAIGHNHATCFAHGAHASGQGLKTEAWQHDMIMRRPQGM